MGTDDAQAHDLAQLMWLEQRTPLQLDWTPGLCAAAREAAQEGNIAVLHTLLARSGFHLTTTCDGQLSGKLHYCSLSASSDRRQHCDCPRLNYQCRCRDTSSACQRALDFCRCAVRFYKAAVCSGQVPVLMWLFGQVHPFKWLVISNQTRSSSDIYDEGPGLETRLLVAAAASEQLQVMAWLHAELPSDLWSGALFAAFAAAAKANRLLAVAWLHDHSNLEEWTANFSSAAAEFGHLRILRWLCLECMPPCPVDELTMTFAARSGKVESLQLLHSLTPLCPMDGSATREAMCHNQLDCLAWLRNSDPPCPWHSSHFIAAARYSAFEGIKMARSLEPPCEWDVRAVLAVIRANNAEILAWMLDHGAPHPKYDQVHDALANYQHTINPDRTVYLILGAHQVPMSEQRMLAAQRARACWFTFMGLVQWARRAQPVHPGSCTAEGIAGGQQAQHMQAGLSLLIHIARLPDELVRHIGAAAGIHHQKGGKVFCEHAEDNGCTYVEDEGCISDEDF